ncbi:IncF plasmid conjugative transfer pilus assembly protein TraB [Escherichia coli]
MASINTIVKRKQYLWLGIVVVGAASAIGGALYLSDVDMSGNGEAVAEQEPVPDMTGVVDTTFDDKVRQHATTEMQVTAAQMQKQYEEIRRELDVLNKQRGDDQRRIEKLGQDNAALAEQVKALGANPVTATGEPVPQMPASPPGPEGEPLPGNTPVTAKSSAGHGARDLLTVSVREWSAPPSRLSGWGLLPLTGPVMS